MNYQAYALFPYTKIFLDGWPLVKFRRCVVQRLKARRIDNCVRRGCGRMPIRTSERHGRQRQPSGADGASRGGQCAGEPHPKANGSPQTCATCPARPASASENDRPPSSRSAKAAHPGSHRACLGSRVPASQVTIRLPAFQGSHTRHSWERTSCMMCSPTRGKQGAPDWRRDNLVVRRAS